VWGGGAKVRALGQFFLELESNSSSSYCNPSLHTTVYAKFWLKLDSASAQIFMHQLYQVINMYIPPTGRRI
jgi:hypothetical protein